MVGDDALVDYPHPRHACAVFKFDTTSHLAHCLNCWYDANDTPRAFPLFVRLLGRFEGAGFSVPSETRASARRGENHRASAVAEKPASRTLFFCLTLTSPIPGRVPAQVLLLRRAGAVP